MPWTEKQARLFRAIEHGWTPPKSSGIDISRADAKRMAAEGVRRSGGGLAMMASGGEPFASSFPTSSIPLTRDRIYSNIGALDPSYQPDSGGSRRAGRYIHWTQYGQAPEFLSSIYSAPHDVYLTDGLLMGQEGGPNERAARFFGDEYLDWFGAQQGEAAPITPFLDYSRDELARFLDPYTIIGELPRGGKYNEKAYRYAQRDIPWMPQMLDSGFVRSIPHYSDSGGGFLDKLSDFVMPATTALLTYGIGSGFGVPELAGTIGGLNPASLFNTAMSLGTNLHDMFNAPSVGARSQQGSSGAGVAGVPSVPPAGGAVGGGRGLDLAGLPGLPGLKQLAGGGVVGQSWQQQDEEFGPRAAAVMRLNKEVSGRSADSGIMPAMQIPSAMTSRLGSLRGPMLSAMAPRGAYSAVLNNAMTPIGRYPRGFARGGIALSGGTDKIARALMRAQRAGADANLAPLKAEVLKSIERDKLRRLADEYSRDSTHGWTPEQIGDVLSNPGVGRNAGRIDELYDMGSGPLFRFFPRRFGEGGSADGGGRAVDYLPAAAALLRKRHINSLARPFARVLARPYVSVEAASSRPLPSKIADARFDLAREGTTSGLKDAPVWKGQGAWMGDKGMEFNDLYVQRLPRSLGRMIDQDEPMRYAAQLGENLEQAGTPVSRFVPHLLNTRQGADAMMVHGVDEAALRRIAEVLGPDVAVSHRPGNRAMIFSIGDRHIPELSDEVNALMSFPKTRFGVSVPDIDRVLLTRENVPWGTRTYRDFGARPRGENYRRIEEAVLARKARALGLK